MTQKVATKRKMKSRQETTSLGYFDSDGKAVNTRRGTPLYKLYRYVPPHRVGFLRRLGLQTGIHFAHLVWNRVWFVRELLECMNVFIVSIQDE